MNTWGVIGNSLVMESLQKSVPASLAHAYLFAGADQVGKFTAAKNFAKAIQCEGAEDFCGQCNNCQSIDVENHPDVYVVRPVGEKRKEINIKTIRDLQHNLSMYPYQGRYKIAIIKDAHKMNTEAANALLKTLEEPSRKVILVLTTSVEKDLLDTILSRCMQYKFLPAREDEIRSYLAGKANEKQLNNIVALSYGRPGMALRLMSDSDFFKDREVVLDDLETNMCQSIASRFKFAGASSEDKDQTIAMLEIWSIYFRDMILVKMNLVSLAVNITRFEQIKQTSAKYTIMQISDILKKIEKTINLLKKTNTNTKLALEVLMLNL